MHGPTRPRNRHLFRVLLAVVLTLGVGPATAQNAARIAYVNTQRIIQESELFTAGRQKLTEEFAARTQVLELEKARLREMEQRRDRDVAQLSSQDAQDLRREIDTLDRSILRRQNEMKQALSRRINELSDTIDRRIQEEIGAYAREQGFDLVLTDGVGFAHPRLDVTDAILSRVNAHAAELRNQ